MLNYLIISSLGIGISYLLYLLLLKQEKIFIFNRFFLLAGIILSLTAPALKIENSIVSPVVSEFSSPGFIHKVVAQEIIIPSSSSRINNKTAFLVQELFLIIYIIITAIMIIRYGRNLFKLKRLLVRYGPFAAGLQLIYMDKKAAPFSFFNYVFVNEEDYKANRVTDSQLKHELAHSRQLHSIDILLIEAAICCFWFNPFIWLYRKSMADNHEFIADQYAAGHDRSIQAYAKKIIRSASNYHPHNFTSGFSFIQTKNRLNMLNKIESPFATRVLKVVIVLVFSSASLLFSSCTGEIPLEPFIVIIDAGHGGEDAGAQFESISEKDIVLEIAKKVNNLGTDSDILVVLSRNSDDYIELLSRTEFADKQNADLLLSLHLNYANEGNMNGVEVYYSEKGKYQEKSFNYSEILLAEQLQSNFSKGEIKTAPFWVLKKANVPSVLIELGFLSNESDRLNLQDPEYLDQVAMSIYNGLIKIKEQTTI